MRLVDFPLLLSLSSFAVLSASAWAGTLLRKKRQVRSVHEDYASLLAATLTLMGLLIGFSFSMAVNRYDQRKNFEAQEANVIGTEYLRSDLLAVPADVARTHSLLIAYLDQRILFYTTRDSDRLEQISRRTTKLQSDLWSSVRGPAVKQPSVLATLTLSGMNEVIDSEGYTQAAWLNRIPRPAWILLEVIAIFSSAFMGFSLQAARPPVVMLFVLPLIVTVSVFLIADIDSPRGGTVNVHPSSLISLAASLRAESRPPGPHGTQTPQAGNSSLRFGDGRAHEGIERIDDRPCAAGGCAKH
jgi:hypothetical protein